MALKRLRLVRGTRAQSAAYLGAPGEPSYNMEDKELVINDGVTPGGATLLRKDRLPAVQFPFRDGGAERSMIRRFGGHFISVADMPRGTEGTPDGDNAAIAAAINASNSGGIYNRKTIILDEGDEGGGPNCRVWRTTGQHELIEGTRFIGSAKDLKIIPANPQSGSSIFLISGGRTEVANLYGVRPPPYTPFVPFDFIQVCKPHDTKSVHLHDIRTEGFRDYCRWFDGDRPIHERIEGINNLRMISYLNNGIDGHHLAVICQGGGGILYDMTDTRLHPQGIGKRGSEGNGHYNCLFQAGVLAGIDGQPALPPLVMKCASFQNWLNCVFSGVKQGPAVSIKGTATSAVTEIEFVSCRILGERDTAGTVGIDIEGAVSLFHMIFGSIQGFTANGARVAGFENNPVASPGDCSFNDVLFRNNGDLNNEVLCDLFAAHVPGTLGVDKCKFDSSAGNNTGGRGNSQWATYGIRTRAHGTGNRWRLPPNFNDGLFNFSQNSGPANIVGIPPFASSDAAVAAGLTKGWDFFVPGAGTLRKVGIGS